MKKLVNCPRCRGKGKIVINSKAEIEWQRKVIKVLVDRYIRMSGV